MQSPTSWSLLHSLLQRCRVASSTEAVGDALSDALFAMARPAVEAEPTCSLHGVGIYRGSPLGWRSSSARAGGGLQRSATPPSQTAWGWVRRWRRPVFIDVLGQVVGPAEESDPAETLEEAGDAEELALGARTQSLLSGQALTHVYGVPLLGSSDRVEGLVTLELRCPLLAGSPLALWERVGPAVQVFVDAAAPALLSRPFSGSAGAAYDLPVVGAAMRPVMELLEVFAAGTGTVLLTGPSGAGKSTLARWVHEHSARKGRPFVDVHLQNSDPDKMMAWLFGWVRGAYTGADRENPGQISEAEGGTLFLDEVGLLSADAQSRLLLFLKEKRYQRLGRTGQDLRADVRIVAATNEDLPARVAAGSFREDLYHRLAGRPVVVPGLDERRDEIPGMSAIILERFQREASPGRKVELSAEAAALLQVQPWPGNLHALENALGRALDLANHAASTGTARVEADHVRRALTPSARPRPVSALREAARTWLDALERGDSGLSLSWADARGLFRAYILLEAVERHGDRPAFELLGEHARVASGNHHKELKAALLDVQRFERGEPRSVERGRRARPFRT